jgi:hypothetical protein
VLAEVRATYGPVRGLIHGAGVLADARIEDKTPEQFERVWGTKVQGLRSLLAAVTPEELRVLVLFSSTTARLGRRGQVDYAIANEALNKLAQREARRLPGCRVLSVNWGPWEGGMVSPALRQVFAEEGVGLIPLEAGGRWLVEELRGPGGTVEVVVLAGQPAAPAGGLPLAFERRVDVASHPVLDAHVLDGRPVVPLALMLEWLAHAALHQNPGLQFAGCDELRVFHGITLESGALTVRAHADKAVKADGEYRVRAELHSTAPDGRDVLHARAQVVLATALPLAPQPLHLSGLSAARVSMEQAYRELLFHGPLLQGIESLEGCGEAGIAARVRTAPPPGEWIAHPLRQRWLADPLVLDSAFQLMILWAQPRHGSRCLPCLVGRYRQFCRSFPAAGCTVRVAIRRHNELHALADIDVLGPSGEVLARIEDHESVLDRSLERAFRHNHRPTAART